MKTTSCCVRIVRASASMLILCALAASISPAQWVQQNSGTVQNLRDVAALDSLTMIAVGDSGIILKSTDGGSSWFPRSSGTQARINALAFYPTDHHQAIAVGRNVMLRTTDEGESWAADSLAGNFISVACSPDSIPAIWAGADGGNFHYSNDGGKSWTDDYAWHSVLTIGLYHETPTALEVRLAEAYYSYVGTITDTIAWNVLPYPIIIGIGDQISGGDIRWAVQYLVGDGGEPGPLPFFLRRGGPFGREWGRSYMPGLAPASPLDAAAIPGTGVVYFCGNNNMYVDSIHTIQAIFKSTDYGATWQSQPTGQKSTLCAISFFDENIGAAVGDAGTILITRNGGVTPVSVSHDEQLPSHALLQQNYPNPFNPVTNIQFTIVNRQLTIVKVYDLLGSEVVTLVNEVKEPGTYTVPFDGSALASGIYFYRIQSGTFVQTKKLLLVR